MIDTVPPLQADQPFFPSAKARYSCILQRELLGDFPTCQPVLENLPTLLHLIAPVVPHPFSFSLIQFFFVISFLIDIFFFFGAGSGGS